MASGGARAKSGPARDPFSLNSDRRGVKFLSLPAGGYEGPVPEFPLGPPSVLVAMKDAGLVDVAQEYGLRAREERIWAECWRTPQAAAWAVERWRIYTVAQWVRVAAICESGLAKAADRTTMLRLQEEIGLTGPGLARNGWVIGDAPGTAADDAVEDRDRVGGSRGRVSSRDRMKVIKGGRA